MTTPDPSPLLERPEVLEWLRRGFRQLNRAMVIAWRLGLGWLGGVWPGGIGQILVIEHVGRKSGSAYRSPVNYTICNGSLYCLAAFGPRTDWYRNVMAAPSLAVWLPTGRWEARAADASDHPARLDLVRHVLMDAGFAAPLFGLNPRRINDEELDRVTASYLLVEIVPTRPAATPDGPCSLWWAWILPLGAGIVRQRFSTLQDRRADVRPG